MKTAIITGSKRGIGFACAKALAKEGYRIILSAVSEEKEAAESVAAIRQTGAACDYIRCDVSVGADRENLFSQAEQQYGRVDVLVNNAGVGLLKRTDILETSEESFDRLIRINLKGTFFMCQLAANHMIAQKREGGEEYRPRIVNISSVSSYTSSVFRGEYCVSKAGVSMTTKLFADRLAEYEIPVFEVSPGIILTDMTAPVKDDYQKRIEEGLTPIRRFGTPEDVASCVLAACGGLLDFATGQVLNADGGFSIRRL